MPRFIANLGLLFTEVSLLERFAAAARAGFTTVEVQFPYEHPTEVIAEQLRADELKLFLINLDVGDWAAGERGIVADPSRVAEFEAGVARTVLYAHALGVQKVNCLPGKRLPGVSHEVQWATAVQNVGFAARAFAQVGIQLLVEPLNARDIPDSFLSTSKAALRLLAEVGHPNAALQYDVYHMQRMEGELVSTIRNHLASIGHIQIGDNPGRHQPGTGEINFRFLLQELDRIGYEGYVSLEYVPKPDTFTSLQWIKELGFSL
jgi:hydroxypyruvate isomerase